MEHMLFGSWSGTSGLAVDDRRPSWLFLFAQERELQSQREQRVWKQELDRKVGHFCEDGKCTDV